ncbi:hypothetical protein P7K49_016917, partial [Saguinus oedipus]
PFRHRGPPPAARALSPPALLSPPAPRPTPGGRPAGPGGATRQPCLRGRVEARTDWQEAG